MSVIVKDRMSYHVSRLMLLDNELCLLATIAPKGCYVSHCLAQLLHEYTSLEGDIALGCTFIVHCALG